eukprot:s2653_g10.t1
MHLSIMAALSTIMNDKDQTLFPMLLQGAPTGFDNNIPPSGCFPVAADKTDETIPLSIHTTNWQSAESDLPTTRELVHQELDKGWIYRYAGSIEDAQREFGDKLALGRLGLALSDHRPPRLVVDSSICGVNSRCSIPERTTLPSAQDIFRVYPLRNTDEPMMGFSLDVKSAHKLVVIRESDRGLLGFTLDGAIYFYKVYLSERRTWLRLRDPASIRRNLSSDSHRILQMYACWLQSVSLVKCLRPKPLWSGECAADAMASGDICQIGGFIRYPSGTTIWFSEKFSFDDFAALDIPVTREMQKCIASFETLAQIAILYIFSRSSPGFRFPLRIQSLTDNSGTEAGGNKLFSTTTPLNVFLEKLTLLCTVSGMELDLSHIAGDRNEEADALSRWNFQSDPPFQHALYNRFAISLQQLWHPEASVSVHPPSTYLAWQIP